MSEEQASAPVQEEEQIISEVTQEAVQEEVQEVEASSEGELQGEIEQAIEDGASEEEVVNMVKQFQLKVNGKEFVKELDMSDEDAVRTELQMAAAGRGAMQEAAELKKMYQQEMDKLKSDPFSVLEALGIDPMELSIDRIQKQIELDAKSPDEVEREKVQEELKEARDRASKLEKQIEERESQALYEKESSKLKEEINSALDAHTTLHASPKIVRKVAETMEWAMNNGFDDVTAADVMPTVEKQLLEEMNEMFSDFDEEAIAKYIGAGNMERMRKNKVASVAKKTTSSIADLKAESARPANKEELKKKKERLEDFMRRR